MNVPSVTHFHWQKRTLCIANANSAWRACASGSTSAGSSFFLVGAATGAASPSCGLNTFDKSFLLAFTAPSISLAA